MQSYHLGRRLFLVLPVPPVLHPAIEHAELPHAHPLRHDLGKPAEQRDDVSAIVAIAATADDASVYRRDVATGYLRLMIRFAPQGFLRSTDHQIKVVNPA